MKIHHESHDLIMFFKPEFKYDIDTVGHFHWHENAEFLYVLSDGFKILVDGVLYETKKGDLVFIKEYSVHSFICENENVKLELGQFSLPLLLNGQYDIKPIKTHIRAEELNEDDNFFKDFNHLISLLENIGEVTKSDTNHFAKSVFSAFYFKLMEKFHQEKTSDGLKKERKEFYKIIEFINSNITNDVTVENISLKLYMHRGKLSRIFSKYSGQTVNEYVNALRIEKANKLLDSGYSVTLAAMESGFQSVRTFSDVYKKKMGITPTEYLKKAGG